MTASKEATADANRVFYADLAQHYDTHEDCVVDPRLRARLAETLRFALCQFPANQDLDVLDACGGSGNASLMLLDMGVLPLTVDISPDMLAIYEDKAAAAGYRPRLEIAEIDKFLRGREDEWDLIVFSSALHHLEDYADVVSIAMDRMRRGGILVTVFDPVRVGRAARAVRRADYLAHLLAHDRSGFVARLGNKLKTCGTASANVGAVAERHALAGVEDITLTQLAVARGWDVLRHGHYFEARFALTRLLLKGLRQPSSFSLVLQAPRTSA